MNFKNLTKDFAIKEYPFLIAGPCGAETREQVFNTAKFLLGKIEGIKFMI